MSTLQERIYNISSRYTDVCEYFYPVRFMLRFFYLTGPCTAWNLTIHEYRKNGDPAGPRIYTFCSRDTHKNFTLPWKMNTVVVR